MKMHAALWTAAAKLPLLEPEARFRLSSRQQAGAGESGSELPHSKAPSAQPFS
jgi:hypothetical protein